MIAVWQAQPDAPAAQPDAQSARNAVWQAQPDAPSTTCRKDGE